MKTCPICKSKYPEDANFCPQETCASADGPQRLASVPEAPEPRFKPIERIGGSSTGEVWRARDGQTGTEVALKLVNPAALGSAATQARAEREFKQLMRVSSPRVATIVDCGKLPDERLFVAMELFPCESLASVLRSGPVDLETAKAMIGQVGQALLEAQKAGLVHRDVSPENVLVGPNGDLKVINFPLAAPVTDKVAGDPAYVSPEQAQGKPADQRSNTYSLAAIFYHLLTGEPPFQAPTPQAVLDMHVSSPLLPPSQRRPDAGISAEADRLILKAMDKSSSRRHLTLRLFLNELEAIKEKPAVSEKVGRDAGLAKTMMFGGNQADIARMVAEARAAKAAGAPVAPAAAATPPAPSVPAAPPAAPRRAEIGQTMLAGVAAPHMAPHVQPLAARTPAVNATIMQIAAPPQPAPPKSRQPTPAPYTVTPPPVVVQRPAPAGISAAPVPVTPVAPAPMFSSPAAAPAQSAPIPAAAHPAPAQPDSPPTAAKAADAAKTPNKAGSAFRETLWFKQGDVEQMVADAKAKLQATGKPRAESADIAVDARPLEDRYADDGSVTIEDRKKFSLRTGGTATAVPTVGEHVPGEEINEKEMVGEISGGRRTLILVVAAVVILALVVVVAMMLKGKGKGTAGAPHSVTSTMVASSPPAGQQPPGEPPGQPGKPASDAAVTPGAPPGSAKAKTPGPALGNAGGTAQPKVGGAAGEAKPAQAKKPTVAKRRPVIRHPIPKHKR